MPRLLLLLLLVLQCTSSSPVGGGRSTPAAHFHARKKATWVRVAIQTSKEIREPWEINQAACPPSLCNTSSMLQSWKQGGSTPFFQGDLVLDANMEKLIWNLRQKRAAVRNTSRLWPQGRVPYVFGEGINSKLRRVIWKAMRLIQEKTCIKFRRKKHTDRNYLKYVAEPGCWSYVGRVGGEQKISLGRGCEHRGTAIHETVHSLGFWHEQSRPDRAKYIRINEKNITPSGLRDFQLLDQRLVNTRQYAYDYLSITHYGSLAFTVNGQRTVDVIGVGKELGLTIGKRDSLSELDIAQFKDLYRCNTKKDSEEQSCPKGWEKFSTSCYKFIRVPKKQFAGARQFCRENKSHLVSIENSREDGYLKRYLEGNHAVDLHWRTGGRLVNGTFYWYGAGKKGTHTRMRYTNWPEGYPGIYTSLILAKQSKLKKFIWQGAWIGSAEQLPDYTYSFICEKKAKRKCIWSDYKDVRDYRGELEHSQDGSTCQKWTSQYPHKHRALVNDALAAQDGLGDHNFCRNPSTSRRRKPWCFTTKRRRTWNYCDIRACRQKKEP